MEIRKFTVGKEYSTRSACDYDCIFRFKVVHRTEKTVTVIDRSVERRCKITVYDGAETIMPMGRYSMAPILRA